MRSAHGIAASKDWDETIYNVFHREYGRTIRHFWGSDMTYAPRSPGSTTAQAMPQIRYGASST